MLLKKGIEVEQYVGQRNGQILPLSALISQSLSNFSVEPDQRNVEFITDATESYENLLKNLIGLRMKLRDFLTDQNPDWTIVPGSSLSLPFDKGFIFSKPEDPYHKHIHDTHGISIITTSLHFNIGIDDPEEIVRLTNLMRMEAPLILALSASSPFYDGALTGYQSHRWVNFPKVPEVIPFFKDHQDYCDWMNINIKEGNLFNVRHFWGAVRPNGPNRPDEINRLEIRIADLCTSWELVLALMTWIELRVNYFFERRDLVVPHDDPSLVLLSDENENFAARNGLTAHFSDWISEEETTVYEAIEKRLEDNSALAEKLGLTKYLKPIEKVLVDGNEAAQKIEKYDEGYTLEEIMEEWVEECAEEDANVYADCLNEIG